MATASRANLGGMIGNNSAGARSIVHGKTLDHVRGLGVVLADGSTATFGPLSPAEWERAANGKTLAAGAYRAVRDLAHQHQDEIARRFPRKK